MLETTLVGDASQLEALAGEWDALAVANALPTAAPGWVLPCWRHAVGVTGEVRAVVVRQGEDLVGLAPFFVDRGFCNGADYRLLGAMVDGTGLLAAPGRDWDVAEAVAAALADAEPRPDAILLESAPLGSHWPLALRTHWPAALAPVMRQYRVEGCPSVTIGQGSFAEWMQGKSSNFRSQMRRMRRQFDQAGGTIRASTAATLRDDIDSYLRLHAARWEGRGASQIVALGDRMALLLEDAGRALLDSSRFRLRILEVDGAPISAQLFLAAGGEVVYVNGGWDERFAHLKPSMLALLDAIEQAFDGGERRLNLGPGDHPYKLRFADANEPLAWTLLMVPGRRLPATIARTAPMLAGHAVRRGVRRTLSDDQLDQLRALLRRTPTPDGRPAA